MTLGGRGGLARGHIAMEVITVKILEINIINKYDMIKYYTYGTAFHIVVANNYCTVAKVLYSLIAVGRRISCGIL